MTRRFNTLPTPRPVHRPMAQWPERTPTLRLFWHGLGGGLLLLALFAVATLAIVAASSDQPPASDGTTRHIAEAGVGRDLPR